MSDMNPFLSLIRPEKAEAFEQLRRIREEKTQHGSLRSFSSSSSSMGMMFNSNTLNNVSVHCENDESGKPVQLITFTEKKAFQNEITRTLKPAFDVLGRLMEIIDRENLAAWADLRPRYDDVLKCMDYSSSYSISFVLNDSIIGGPDYNYIKLDPGAVRQHGGGDVIDELEAVLHEAAAGAEVLSESAKETGGGILGFMSMTAPASQTDTATKVKLPSYPWVCPACSTENTGKFCTECGNAAPQ